MRVLCYAQALSGVGHDVRMRAIARGLADAHEVHVVAGGRALPHPHEAAALRTVTLPALARVGGALVALDGTVDVRAVLAERARALVRAVEHIRPDALLIDHYPFSKWELEGEIAAAIDAARTINPRARIICSLRDVAPQTRHERVEHSIYEARVLAALGRGFNAVFLHVDPAFTRIEAHFTRAADIPVPVQYTGFVVAAEAPVDSAAGADPYAVLSCGGGAWNVRFLLDAMDAFREASSRGTLGRMSLRVFAGAFFTDGDVAALERAATGGPFEIRRFASDFAGQLQHCALSISRAGYNTCAALLHAGVRAVLVPDPAMSDQAFRARRLAELGLATVVDGADVAALVAALRRAVESPLPQHRLNLDGATRSRVLIEALFGPS